MELRAIDFESAINGRSTGLYTIQNQNGLKAVFTNYGVRLVSLKVPDAQGEFDDIVLGYSSLENYRDSPEKYFGATIGRYANRIRDGRFSIQGCEFNIDRNNNDHHLHGGFNGFESVVWNTTIIDEHKLLFSRTSPDGEAGFPGNVKVSVSFELTDTNQLVIDYKASTDRMGPVNFTHHSYFNLKGEGRGDILDHFLKINADHYTPVDKGLIPTGDLELVENTPFDFRHIKTIGDAIAGEHQQLIYGKGFDHNFVIHKDKTDDSTLSLAARVEERQSGRFMEVYTNEPGLQFYSGNFMDGSTRGKRGAYYDFREAFCLETQHFPDSPNQPKFPSTLLKPGQEYRSTCIYKFGIL